MDAYGRPEPNLSICGTCGQDAEATSDNEGYSSCCNDRIEYGNEAAETLRQLTDMGRI